MKLFPGQTIFLDRDGTINRSPQEGEYITRPEELHLLPGSAEAIRILNKSQATVVLVTNQRGISLGLMSEEDLEHVHSRLAQLLAKEGAHIDHILYCPHSSCGCRKPQAGLLLQAAEQFAKVSLQGAIIIGDSARDIGAGRAAGIDSILLGRASPGEPRPTEEKKTLLAAVKSLINNSPAS